jgi:hypothetical protein
VTFSSSTPGDYAINVTGVSDSGGGGYNNQANWTLHVLAPPDSTPPVITPNVSGTLGNNGWYTSDVTVSWSVVDNESAISSSSGCDPTTINTDTAGTTLTCTATSVGGTSSQSVTIKRDAHEPSLSCPSGPSGWQANDVTLTCAATDVGPSGLASTSDASFALSTTVGAGNENASAQTGSKTVYDNAGNPASIGPFSFMVDRKAPSITCPTPDRQFTVQQSPANVVGSASDGGSGLATSANPSAAADTSSITVNGAARSVSLSAEDNVANQAQKSCSYTVIYGVGAVRFLQPINWTAHSTSTNPDVSTFKAGSTVPTKVQVVLPDGTIVQPASALWVTPQKGATTNQPIDETVYSEPAMSGSSYVWNASGEFSQYNWGSPRNGAGSYWLIGIKLDDGQVYRQYISLR